MSTGRKNNLLQKSNPCSTLSMPNKQVAHAALDVEMDEENVKKKKGFLSGSLLVSQRGHSALDHPAKQLNTKDRC